MDEIEERLRKMRPVGASRSMPVPEHMRERLASIPEGGSADSRRFNNRRLTLAGLAAVLVIAASVTVTFLNLGGGDAQAVTPPPLKFSSSGEGLSEVLATAIAKLSAEAGPTQAERSAQTLSWDVQMNLDSDDHVESLTLLPARWTTLTWATDGSAETTVTAALPYWADKSETATLPAPGTVLEHTTWAAGEAPQPSNDPPPATNVADLRAYLTSIGVPIEEQTTPRIFSEIANLLTIWTLTNAEEANILRLLGTDSSITSLGVAKDRVGREVQGLRVTSEDGPGWNYTLLLSKETGRIVGYEQARLTAEGPLKAGDVIGYSLWEVGQ